MLSCWFDAFPTYVTLALDNLPIMAVLNSHSPISTYLISEGQATYVEVQNSGGRMKGGRLGERLKALR